MLKAEFDNQGKHYLANLYNNGYKVVPTINDILDLDILGNYEKYLVKPVNGYASYGIIETDKSNINNYWNKNYVIQPKLYFDSEVQFYFVGNKYEFAQIFIPKKLLSHENAIFYTPTIEETLTIINYQVPNTKKNSIFIPLGFISICLGGIFLYENKKSNHSLSS